jgi:pimeloyl-[acyl-carrier protein] methyl ester esterase
MLPPRPTRAAHEVVVNLRVREYGSGDGRQARVLLHGWGFDGAVMEPLARGLAPAGRVLVIDLPGFRPGDARPPGTDVDALADAVAQAAPDTAHWTGWSLGGLVAMAVAQRYPNRVAGVDLVAATPRFPADADWPGIGMDELEGFRAAVSLDPEAAHRRFLGFQLAGSDAARPVLRWLRALGERNGLPPRQALADGLDILRDTDLRSLLSALSCPVRALLGGADPLVPAAIEPHLAAAGVEVRVIPGAGHVPFLSHPEAVHEALEQPAATG